MATELTPFPLLPPNGGMILAGPEGQVPPGAARYIVDGLVDRAGEIRQRGPIKVAGSFPQYDLNNPTIITSTRTPRGDLRFLIGYQGGMTRVYDANGVFLGSPGSGQPVGDFQYLDAKPNLAGGVFISQVQQPNNNRKMSRAEWRGGYGLEAGVGGGAAKRLTNLPSAASDTVNFAGGTALTTAHIGCFLWSGPLSTTMVPVGWIYDVPTATSARILTPFYNGSGAAALTHAYLIQPLHLHQPLIFGQGTISTLTTSTTVTGSNTKFAQASNLVAGTYHVYRQRDSLYIGLVSAFNNDNSITLSANAAAKMDNEQYYITNAKGTDSGGWGYLSNGLTISTEFSYYHQLPGAWTAVYAGRQWDAVRVHPQGGREDLNTVWYSEKNRMLVTDRVPGSGQYIVVGDSASMQDEIQNIEGTRGGLVVWKKGSTFLISQKNPPFSAVPLVTDDGILNPSAYTRFRDGVVWAGYKGVWYFDGSSVQNIVAESLGAEYPRMISNLIANGDGLGNDVIQPTVHTHGDHVWVNLKATAPSMGLYIRRP